MKKVIYRQRTFLDNYRCIDNNVTRYFVKCWTVGGLTYFKENQYNTFSVPTDDIINIEID